jgi:hypothetical protein
LRCVKQRNRSADFHSRRLQDEEIQARKAEDMD